MALIHRKTFLARAFICLKSLMLVPVFVSVSYGKDILDLMPFTVSATSAVLINAVSGEIVYEQNPDERIQPASLAKIMTLYLAFKAVEDEHVSLSDMVRISKKAWQTKGSKMFVRVDDMVELEKLIKGIAVVSGNDACVAVAEHIAGIEAVFVDRMNQEAAALNMTNTVFANSHGLPSEYQVTTARDMALLAYNYINRYPDAMTYHQIKEMTFSNITQNNRNGLLWLDYGVDGLKTGWVTDAGFHLIATAQNENDRFIAVVMGCRNRAQRENEALKLLNYGFRNFKTFQVVESFHPLFQIQVWQGTRSTVMAGVWESLYTTIRLTAPGEVSLDKQLPSFLTAPISMDKPIGSLSISIDGAGFAELDLMPLEHIERAGVFKVLMHKAYLFFFTAPYIGAIIFVIGCSVLVVLFFFTAYRKKRRGPDNDMGIDKLINTSASNQ